MLFARLTVAATLRRQPFLVGFYPLGVLFCDQKSTRKVPLLPGRGARLKGAWVRAAHERFASAPLRIQERTDWPLPAANALRLDGLQFLLLVSYPQPFVGSRDIWPRRGQSVGRRQAAAANQIVTLILTDTQSDTPSRSYRPNQAFCAAA